MTLVLVKNLQIINLIFKEKKPKNHNNRLKQNRRKNRKINKNRKKSKNKNNK
jgi:hypothetical protein